MDKRAFKDKVYGQLAEVTRALANPRRLEIIELLAQGEFSVERIAAETGLSVANASQHLQVLKGARVVDVSRKGNFIFYRLASENVFSAWRALRAMGMERNANVDKIVREFRSSRFNYESLTMEELLRRMESGDVTLVDVRSEGEYRMGHIPKAVSIPIDQLAGRLKELPRHGEIVAYCRGPFCVFADEAVATLAKAGYRVSRLEEGFPDWLSRGLPVGDN